MVMENQIVLVAFLLTRPMRDVTISLMSFVLLALFLLTRPMRDVTVTGLMRIIMCTIFLLTRPMRDVTSFIFYNFTSIKISTHTPHAGRDVSRLFLCTPERSFLLTRPMRDVTIYYSNGSHLFINFYSHAPCGT